jgi:hypothetical protein
MKTKQMVPIFLATSLFFAPNVYAENLDSENTVDTIENIDTLPPPSQDLIEQNHWVESSVAPEGQVPSGQDGPEVWAVVDEDGNTLNIMVCDIDYCGSGRIPVAWDGDVPTEWVTVVRQSERDSETGNYNPGHWGQYDFAENVWRVLENGSTYIVPIEHGAEWICIDNCLIINSNSVSSLESSASADGTSPSVEHNPSITDTLQQKVLIKPKVINDVIPLRIKIKDNVLNNSVKVVATKNGKQKIWNKKLKKKVLSIKIPKRYSSWKISVRYRAL